MRHRLSVLPLRLADDACFSAAGGLEFGCKDTNYFSIHQIKFLLFFFFCTDYQLYILKKRRCMDAGELYFSSFDGVFCIFLRDAVGGHTPPSALRASTSPSLGEELSCQADYHIPVPRRHRPHLCQPVGDAVRGICSQYPVVSKRNMVFKECQERQIRLRGKQICQSTRNPRDYYNFSLQAALVRTAVLRPRS